MSDRFNTVKWAHHTNIYEVNLRQYTPEGTFTAFAKELPRLKKMGVHTLWFMPLTPISQKNKKGLLGSYYACADYEAINPEFGTHDDFKTLVKQAHKMGFKIIIDWVANHTGWDHVWTVEHPDFFLLDPSTNDFKTPSGMEDIIALNYGNPALQVAMIDAMKYWVKEYNIDGFRADLASWVTLDFWKIARKELNKIKPLFWLGEFDELESPEYGEAFDASYSWKWMHKTEEFFKQGLPLKTLTGILKNYDDLGDKTMRTWFTSNHDENSWNGTEFEKYGEMAKLLAVFSTTWNGIPLIYSGQELPNKKRLAFFEKDAIEWTGEYALNDFYSTLLHLHSLHPALRSGDPLVQTFILKTTAPQNIFAFLRSTGIKDVLVILNFSAENTQFDIIGSDITGKYKNIFSGAGTDLSKELKFEMRAWEWLVFEK